MRGGPCTERGSGGTRERGDKGGGAQRAPWCTHASEARPPLEQAIGKKLTVEALQLAVVQAVDEAVDGQRLARVPGLLHDGAGAHVEDLRRVPAGGAVAGERRVRERRRSGGLPRAGVLGSALTRGAPRHSRPAAVRR